MIRLCLILEDKLYHYHLQEDGRAEIHTPLSLWQPARMAEQMLQLPAGWTTEDDAADQISLQHEANVMLTDGESSALMMIRLPQTDSLCSVKARMTERFTVGRSHSNQICCRDGFLSAFHGVFTIGRDGRLCYEDASTNGTFINGELLRGGTRRLRDGDCLEFPPLLSVTVDGAALRILYPKEHGQLLLEEQPTAEAGMLCAAVYLPGAGRLRHIALPDVQYTGEELRRGILARLSPEDTALLQPDPVLRMAGETALVAPGAAFALREGMLLVLG